MTSINSIGSSSLVSGYLDSTSNKDINAKTVFKKLSIDTGGDGKTIKKEQLDAYVKKAEATAKAEADAIAKKDDATSITAKATAVTESTSATSIINAEVSISKEELAGLKQLQSKFNDLSGGGDTISFSNMSKNQDILTSMDAPDDTTSEDAISAIKTTTMQEINDYLTQSALSTSFNDSSTSSTKSGLTSMLKTLLTGTTDEYDDSNSELISTLTNLIASSKSSSTIEAEA